MDEHGITTDATNADAMDNVVASIEVPQQPVRSTDSGPRPTPKIAGRTYIIQHHDNKLWPVVLSDNATAPPKFLLTRHRGIEEHPAVCLGQRRFLWVTKDALHEYDPNRDYLAGLEKFDLAEPQEHDTPDVVDEKRRRRGFTHDIPMRGDHKYWTDRVINKKREPKAEKKEKKKSKSSKRRRDDQDVGAGAPSLVWAGPPPLKSLKMPKSGRTLELPNTLPTKRKLGGDGATSRQPVKTYYDSDDSENLSIPVKSKKQKTATYAKPMDEDYCQKFARRLKPLGPDTTPNNDAITIFAGPEQVPFRVPRDAVGKCDLLADSVRYDNTVGSFIDLMHTKRFETANVSYREFDAVAGYLRTGTVECQNQKGIPNFHGMPNIQKDKEAIELAGVFATAAKILHEPLQGHAFERIRKLYPLPKPRNSILIAEVFCAAPRSETNTTNVESEFRIFVTDRIAEMWWRLAKDQPKRLQKLLERNETLRQDIYKQLSQDGSQGLREFDQQDEDEDDGEYDDED